MLNKFIYSFCLSLSLGFLACAPKTASRIPGPEVMQFPYSMSLKDNHLVISATSSDGRYDLGRLVTVDTNAIKLGILNADKNPLPWASVVRSNILTPRDVGKIIQLNKAVNFTERQRGTLLSLPTNPDGIIANAPMVQAKNIAGAQTLSFFKGETEHDTSGLLVLAESKDKDTFLVSYLSAGRIDMVEQNKASNNLALKLKKSFEGKSLLQFYVEKKELKNRKAVTKTMAITKKNDGDDLVYFLLELHHEKNTFLKSAKALYLVAIKRSDLMAEAPITKPMVKVFDLKKDFNIQGGKDLFIDAEGNEALVLASNPQALFKLDLKTGNLLKMASVCSKASTMAVNANLDLVIIPCITDDQVMSYSYSQIEIQNTSNFVGRWPVFAVIDPVHELIYCSYYLDGIIGIFDKNLNYKGHLFDKALNQYSGQ